MTGFFNSIEEVSEQHQAPATTNLRSARASRLTQDIDNMHDRVADIQTELGQTSDRPTRIKSTTCLRQIRQLNVKISSIEGGNSSASQAGRSARSASNGRRFSCRRCWAFRSTSSRAAVSIFPLAANFWCSKGSGMPSSVKSSRTTAAASDVIQFADTHAAVNSATGEVQGFVHVARSNRRWIPDQVGRLRQRHWHSNSTKCTRKGRAQVGFSQLTSQSAVADADGAHLMRPGFRLRRRAATSTF